MTSIQIVKYLLITWISFYILEFILSEMRAHRFLSRSQFWVFSPLLNIFANQQKNDLAFSSITVLAIICAFGFRRGKITSKIMIGILIIVSIQMIVSTFPSIGKYLTYSI